MSNGRILNERYELRERVGGGGMADVYRARDTKDRRIVAVKEMRLDSRLSPEDQEMRRIAFEREARILEKLTQRPDPSLHIPAFYESFEENGRSYLVMQFIEGKTLKKLIEEPHTQDQLQQELVIWCALELCKALIYLHQQPIPVVFRDLKPDNIMIDMSGRVYLVDFGIARHFTMGKQHDTIPFGTYGYAPPELCSGEQTEMRSDLFSLGATLHYCLTGLPPSGPGPNWFKFAPVRDYNLQVSARFDKLIMRLVATKKAKRPANAEEVMRELRAIQREMKTGILPEDIDQPVSFYDAVTARAVRLFVSWSQLNMPVSFYNAVTVGKARPFVSEPQWNMLLTPLKRAVNAILLFAAWLVAWLYVQRQKAGPWFRDTCIPFLRSLPQSQGRVQGQKNPSKPLKPAPNNPPAPRAPSSSILTQLVSLSRSIMVNTPGAKVPAWKLHITLLLGLLFGTALWSIAALVMFGTALHMVLWLLVLLLFLIALITYLHPGTSPEVPRLLPPVVLSTIVVCFVLLSQHDMLQIINSYTINQILSAILSLALLILTISSLIRPVNSMRWLDRSAIIMLALWEIIQWDVLGSSATLSLHPLFFIANDTSQTINWIILGALLLILLLPLVAIKSSSDGINSFCIVSLSLPALFLQYIFVIPNGIFCLLYFGIIFIALKLPNEQSSRTPNPWQRLRRLPLLLLTLSLLCLQMFINTHMQPLAQSSITGIDLLVAQSFVHTSLLVNIGLILLLTLIIYSWKKNGQLWLLDHIVVIVIGLVCLIIDASHKTDMLQNITYTLKSFIFLYTPTINAVLLFLTLSVLLYLVERTFLNKLLFNVLAGLLGISRRLLMLLCASSVLLILLALGDGKDWWDPDTAWLVSSFVGGPAQPLPPVPGYQLLFLVLLLLVSITLMKLVVALFKRWEVPLDRDEAQTRRKLPFIEFDWLDYILMFCTIISLLVIWNVPEQQAAPVSLTALWLRFVTGRFPLVMAIVCLLMATAISLLWLRISLKPQTHQILCFLLPTSLVCLLCSLASLPFPYLNLIFVPLLLAGSLLLIGSIFLVLLTELAP